MSRTRWIVLIVVIVLAALIVGGVAYRKIRGQVVAVQTEKVERMDLIEVVSASGKIKPVTEVQISATVSAEIAALGVKEGDRVKKGDFLVQLDQTRYLAALEQAEAAVRSAEANAKLAAANLEQAEKKRERTRKLLEQSLASQEAFELADTQYKVSKATHQAAQETVAQARATLVAARDELAKTRIVSPMDGTISRLDKEVGEIAVGSTFTKDVIMVVADLTAMEMVAEVDENDVPDVHLGAPATIEVDALPGEKFRGTVKDIARSAKVQALGTQEQSTNFDVKVSVEGDISKLRPGMSATVEIQVAEKKGVLAVPIQCLTMRDPKKTGPEARNLARVKEEDLKEVLFAVHGGRVRMVPVQTGISSETHIEVSGDGVQEGMEVVSGPFKTLNKEMFDDDKVRVDNSGALEKKAG